WPKQVEGFVRAIANLLAIREAAGETADVPQAAAPRPGVDGSSSGAGSAVDASGVDIPVDIDPGLGRRRAMAFTTRLAKHAGDTGVAGAGLIDRLGVMSLYFTDARALAEPVLGTAEETVIVYLIRELENAACEQGLGYLKFLTDQVVVAGDPNEDADRGLQRLADFAVAAQGICERLFVEQRTPLVFRIGIDVGPVIGSIVGRERHTFNLWGEAVQMAGSMARTGLPGVIQVTETVYQALNGQYLFQLRGHHYLEGVGEFSTYLMSGHP
ncbi:MAG: adenylate/guanylate cyclase domain-containing protein, partial [Sedimenticolaceae bacterium]